MLDEKQFSNNPQFRLGTLQKEEQEVARRLHEKEKEIRILLAQLQAIHDLVEEAGKELSDEEYSNAIEEIEEQREAQKQAIQNLEEVINQSTKVLGVQVDEELGQAYTAITAKKLSLATGKKSIERLYELAYTNSAWTEQESKEFFTIRDAIATSKNYDLADVLKQNIDQTYKALQFVATQKKEDIKRTYNAEYAMTHAPKISTGSPYPTFEPVKIKEEYKPNFNSNL